ncbi:RHOMBOID-like protein 2 [Ziziphus jujuba]|uniref:RHOMBOID-like protein n=1 Tax=Ziziphus jujuba TaxID=326968 RepID=A0ABM3I4C8_ZIZJJ|nr:RHOMBOID-like protein 2 [Ziziphus jujuba]
MDFLRAKMELIIYVTVIGLVSYFISNNFGFEKDWIMAKFLGMFSFQFLKENPLLLPADSSELKKLGALEWYKFVHGHLGFRLIICIWFHAGIIHFLANMLNLVCIMIQFQKQLGYVRIIYLLSGICWSLLFSDLFLQHKFSIGAFRAMFGLFGAMLYLI